MFRKSTLAPRNPLVAASLFRKAGTHRRHGKAARAKEKQRQRHRDQVEFRLRQDSSPKRILPSACAWGWNPFPMPH